MKTEDQRIANIKCFIESEFEKVEDWGKVKTLDRLSKKYGDDFNRKLDNVICILDEEDFLTEALWNELVDELSSRDEKKCVIKLGKRVKNNAQIPPDKYSSWKLYANKLKDKGWSEDSIENIKKSSFEILQNLSVNNAEDGPVKGLVVGNVQSGKTANMAGLMAMAADNGFNCFIILSGLIENLRQQTSKRLFKDMNTSGKGNLHWIQVENPGSKSKLSGNDLSEFKLGETDKNRYFTVCLKNKTRLINLKNWLSSDLIKAKQLKILVIDDEADQASINTNQIEEEEPTTINKYIKEIVNNTIFKSMNYISYTATPYANVLNETSEQSLYPKDFIILLESSEDYIGPKQLFGIEEPENNPVVEIIRAISESDKAIVRDIHDGSDVQQLPDSFVQSIHWYLLTVASLRALDYHEPISMLIHTSFIIDHHERIAKKVQQYLQYMQTNIHDIFPDLEILYANESLDFKRINFLEGLANYSKPNDVPNYPEWDIVKKHLERLFRLSKNELISHVNIGESGEPKYHKGIHLAIDNSKSKAEDQIARLVYPKSKQKFTTAPAFIVIGGNTLSRGLTLEGLTTTYFLRSTNQADTLMQMGRWFGYRPKYEIFPRIWLDRTALERFEFLSQMNEELRDEIKMYAETGNTPLDYAPRIKNSSNYKLIRLTSKRKQQAAEPKEFDFTGFNAQTIYFEKDEKKLEENLSETISFLNSLPKPIVNSKHLIWKNIGSDKIENFLKSYHVSLSDTKMASLPALLEWIKKSTTSISNWNVILASLGDIKSKKNMDSEWNIQGYSPKPVTRTKLKSRSSDQLVSIGALRSPLDLLADMPLTELNSEEKNITKPYELQNLREKHGYGNVPQLLIYRIDKDNRTEEEYYEQTNNPRRSPLNFPKDLIGINIMIPGGMKNKNITTYIAAKINVDAQMIEDNDYKEDGE